MIRELRAYVAANEFLEPYCKRIVNRLFSIEKLRTCPTDLSREISGLVFASSRCLDIPELEDFTTLVKKEFGEEFVHVATELRGGCDMHIMVSMVFYFSVIQVWFYHYQPYVHSFYIELNYSIFRFEGLLTVVK